VPDQCHLQHEPVTKRTCHLAAATALRSHGEPGATHRGAHVIAESLQARLDRRRSERKMARSSKPAHKHAEPRLARRKNGPQRAKTLPRTRQGTQPQGSAPGSRVTQRRVVSTSTLSLSLRLSTPSSSPAPHRRSCPLRFSFPVFIFQISVFRNGLRHLCAAKPEKSGNTLVRKRAQSTSTIPVSIPVETQLLDRCRVPIPRIPEFRRV